MSDDLIRSLKHDFTQTGRGAVMVNRHDLAAAIDFLAETAAYRKATGGLPPELVAKALAFTAGHTSRYRCFTFTADEMAALRAATFEVPA